MATAGGHWATLSQAAKLTQSTKIPGVFEEDVKRNNPLDRVPVAQAAGTGLKIEWLREKSTTESAVVEAAIGTQLSWGEDITYDEVDSTLRYMYIQRKLDRFVQNIYGTYNDYRAQILLECEKGLKRRIGDRFIYADTTYGGALTQMDGIHALAAERGTPNAAATATYSDLNLDQEASNGLSLGLLRRMIDAMKFGVDEIWVAPVTGIHLDAAYDEAGFSYSTSSNARNFMSLITRTVNDIGRPILFFAGIPIIRTDYLSKTELSNTGTGLTGDIRLSTTGDQSSLFGFRFGNVLAREPGITFAYGGTEGEGDLYELWTWDRLEDYNAGGMRLDTYGTVLLGSTMCLGRIHDIADSAVIE